MIKITSLTIDDYFCKIIENNVNLLWKLYIQFGIKTWLIPQYPITIKERNRICQQTIQN